MYGCSVWASVLKTKAGTKKLRSFQRLISIAVTNSFKTASTESLLILSNLIPIDIRVLEIAVLRLLGDKNRPFSKRVAQILSKRFHPTDLLKSAVQPFSVHSSPVPPWDMRSNILRLSQDSFVGIGSFGKNTVRFYATFFRTKDRMGYCYGKTSYSGVVEDTNRADYSGWSEYKQVTHSAILRIFSQIKETRCSGHIEIFSDSKESFSWTNPRSKLSALEIEILTLFYPIKHRCTLFLCPKTSKVAGLELVKGLCALPTDSQVIRDTAPTLLTIKKDIHSSVLNLWNSEWLLSSTGTTTKRFFPTVTDALTLESRLMPSFLSQILTGHSLLNGHQFRLKFGSTSRCACGYADETVDHFLFHCTRFTSRRENFVTVSLNQTGVWPPPLSCIPAMPNLLSPTSHFITSTKRLARRTRTQ